jgi:hypothetical protein
MYIQILWTGTVRCDELAIERYELCDVGVTDWRQPNAQFWRQIAEVFSLSKHERRRQKMFM